MSDLLRELEELSEKATKGPYFVASDKAHDSFEHKDSGLALIDTGRQEDWPVLRLGEWPTTKFIAALLNAWPQIREALRDAERYRWLREHRVMFTKDFGIYEITVDAGQLRDHWDAAIDAARRKP